MKEIKLSFSQLLSKRYDILNKKLSLIIIVLLFICFALLMVDSLNKSKDPEYYDTTGYLGEANFISNHGGVSNFINLCISGTYKQANQHPLYILLLTPLASTNISFLIEAKLISAIIGILTMVFLYIISRKMYGDLVASISVFAMTFNLVFIKWSGIVACESLLVLFSILSIYFIIDGFNKNKSWIYAGIFAGLTFLTKGSALFLIPGFGLAALIVYKLKIFKNKFFWSFFILFILISSPLLIRNIIVYRDPLFNVNKYIAELGREEVYNNKYSVFSPDIGAGHWRFEKNENKQSAAQTRSSYLDVFNVSNLSKKVILEAKLFLNTLSIGIAHKYLPGKLNVLFELLIFFFFIAGILREKNLGSKIYIITTLLVFLVALSLFRPIPRYFLPIIPFIWIYISLGIFTLLELVNKKLFQNTPKIDILSYMPHLIILLLILNLTFVVTKKTLANPLKSVEYNENRADLVNWLRKNLNEEDKYTLGPNLNWQLKKGTWLVPPTPARENFSKLSSFLRKHDINYVIIDKNNLTQHRGYNYQKLTKDYFEWDSTKGIVAKQNIDNWDIVYKNHKNPVEYMVYKINYN